MSLEIINICDIEDDIEDKLDRLYKDMEYYIMTHKMNKLIKILKSDNPEEDLHSLVGEYLDEKSEDINIEMGSIDGRELSLRKNGFKIKILSYIHNRFYRMFIEKSDNYIRKFRYFSTYMTKLNPLIDIEDILIGELIATIIKQKMTIGELPEIIVDGDDIKRKFVYQWNEKKKNWVKKQWIDIRNYYYGEFRLLVTYIIAENKIKPDRTKTDIIISEKYKSLRKLLSRSSFINKCDIILISYFVVDNIEEFFIGEDERVRRREKMKKEEIFNNFISDCVVDSKSNLKIVERIGFMGGVRPM
jgi:hypothetical protein